MIKYQTTNFKTQNYQFFLKIHLSPLRLLNDEYMYLCIEQFFREKNAQL